MLTRRRRGRTAPRAPHLVARSGLLAQHHPIDVVSTIEKIRAKYPIAAANTPRSPFLTHHYLPIDAPRALHLPPPLSHGLRRREQKGRAGGGGSFLRYRPRGLQLRPSLSSLSTLSSAALPVPPSSARWTCVCSTGCARACPTGVRRWRRCGLTASSTAAHVELGQEPLVESFAWRRTHADEGDAADNNFNRVVGEEPRRSSSSSRWPRAELARRPAGQLRRRRRP
jgi:hypothetical protein